MMRAVSIAAVIIVAGLVSLAPTAGASEQFLTVAVVGRGPAMQGRYELQIGSEAWSIDRPGFQLVESSSPLTALLWHTDRCDVVLRFEVGPGRGIARSLIDLGDGTRRPSLWRGGSDAVPTQSVSVRPAHVPSCALPDTATEDATSPRVAIDAAVWPTLFGSVLVGALILRVSSRMVGRRSRGPGAGGRR